MISIFFYLLWFVLWASLLGDCSLCTWKEYVFSCSWVKCFINVSHWSGWSMAFYILSLSCLFYQLLREVSSPSVMVDLSVSFQFHQFLLHLRLCWLHANLVFSFNVSTECLTISHYMSFFSSCSGIAKYIPNFALTFYHFNCNVETLAAYWSFTLPSLYWGCHMFNICVHWKTLSDNVQFLLLLSIHILKILTGEK